MARGLARRERLPRVCGVVSSLGGGDLVDMRFGPVTDGGDRLDEGLAEAGESILDPRRDLRVDVTGDQAVTFHPAQCLGQHLGGDVTELAAQLGKPHGAVAEQQHDKNGPFVADPVEHQPGRTAGVEEVALVDAGPLGTELVEQARRCNGNHEVLIAR